MSEYIDNSQERKQALKKLILDLHAGLDLTQARSRFSALVGDVSAVEIAQLEQELIEEGLPAEEIKVLCDVHVAVFQEALDGEAAPEMTPGHPVHTLKYENFAVGELLKLIEGVFADLQAEGALAQLRAYASQLAEVEKVYSRKENLLFPILERHGVTGPSSVMWGIHDDVRAQVKALRQSLEAGQLEAAKDVFEQTAEAIRAMFYKEEHILYPTSLKMLSDEEWVEIRDQSEEIGYCLVRPGDDWHPDIELKETGESERASVDGLLPLDVGALGLEQVNLLLTHLPVDVTYVDETDTVRYFSQAKGQRIFTRTAAIIGRKVQNCHPPSSVHIVSGLLDEFRAGTRDSAEFWLQMAGMFVHIRYFALRDAQGKYRGTIEVTQDLAPLRALEGERRLLDEGN